MPPKKSPTGDRTLLTADSTRARTSDSPSRIRSTTPGALQATVRITPVVDLRRLTFVRVLQWNP
jgi:hypothetical protein